MKTRNRFSACSVAAWSILLAVVASCTDAQPTFECATRNNEVFQVRYYLQSSSCAADAGFLTSSLQGGTAGMQTYMLLSKEGGGGPSVVFRDVPEKLDRSATKLGLRLDALLTANVPAVCGDAARESAPSSDPNLFVMLPRYGTDEVCRPLDSGIATSTTKFPTYACKDGTSFGEVTINTKLSDFALVSSARIPGYFAKGTLTFQETHAAAGSCTSVYKLVLLNPIVQCSTDLDCSPEPVPEAVRCTSESPAAGEYCFTGNDEPGSGASKNFGSGINPFLFRTYTDGGFDVRNTCDGVLKRCIWDSDSKP